MTAALFRLPGGREVTREEAEAYIQLRREQHRRHEANRLATEREAIVAKCRTLHGFIEEFWYVLEPVAKFKSGWALRAMCDHLEAVTRGDIKRLLMTVPPGMMKSLLLVFWTAWEWGPMGMPHIQVLATSYSQKNAFRDNQKLRDLVSSEKFQALWPVQLRTDTNAISKFANTLSGWCEARPFSKMTGGRANRVKIDDPHDTENAESPVQRSKTVRIMREAISDRVTNENDAIVLIMQRLHESDCAAAAKEMGYTHLELPMEFEPDRRCRTVLRPANDGNPAIVFEDPRTEDGELLFPERFPASWVAQLKRDKGSYAWAGQYQQRPTAREGGMFKRHWFEGKIIGAVPPGTVLQWRHWDLAASTRTTSARTAGVKMGRTPDGRFIVIHVIKTREEGAEVRRIIKGTAETDGRAVKISLPQDPGQAGKVQKQDLVAMLAGFVVVATPETGSKETRAEPFAAQCEAGNVFLVEGEWNADYLDELCMFPGGAMKDQVDASSGAFGRLVGNRGAMQINPAALRRI